MAKLDERISGLETKLKQLRVRQARLGARKRSLASRRARQDDTRRKILLGATVMLRISRGELNQADVDTWLEAALIRPSRSGALRSGAARGIRTQGRSGAVVEDPEVASGRFRFRLLLSPVRGFIANP
jgi:hypothetical protein